ncbi:hypothetical protein CRG98_038469 [Punica granatum]|uniref:Uncharacterized protein n=1 Tax=Punica granatum TaxID=22663 RepID=A0A2I0IAD5_PUNGR|nr:hypothetical protein CRG98_038469 [Punica granatum]
MYTLMCRDLSNDLRGPNSDHSSLPTTLLAEGGPLIRSFPSPFLFVETKRGGGEDQIGGLPLPATPLCKVTEREGWSKGGTLPIEAPYLSLALYHARSLRERRSQKGEPPNLVLPSPSVFVETERGKGD